jgi:uncharacterized OB-fold protein
MWVCSQCGALYGDNISRCIECGGQTRRRTISEGLDELFDGERKAAIKLVTCPQCKEEVCLFPPHNLCPLCYSKLLSGPKEAISEQ